jgi:hypothetical protein
LAIGRNVISDEQCIRVTYFYNQFYQINKMLNKEVNDCALSVYGYGY